MVQPIFLTESVHIELSDERLSLAVPEVKRQDNVFQTRTVLNLHFGVVVTPANDFRVLFFLSGATLTSSMLNSLTINSGTLLSRESWFIC